MKPFARRNAILITVLLIIACAEAVSRLDAVQRLFDPADGGIHAARWRYEHAQLPADVLLMGDSRVMVDASPTVMSSWLKDRSGKSITVQNTGVGGLSMEGLMLMLTEIVLPNNRDELVVCNVSELAVSDTYWIDNDPPTYLRGLSSPLRPETWRTGPGREAVLESWSGLVRLEHRLRPTIEARWPNYLRGTEGYDGGVKQWYGHMPDDIKLGQQEFVQTQSLVDYSPNGFQRQCLDDLLRAARANDVRLILVLFPVSKEFTNLYESPDDMLAYKQTVTELAEAYGVPLVDHYQTPELDEDMFFDLHHTNRRGTYFYTCHLTKDVVEPALLDWDSFCATHVPTSGGKRMQGQTSD